MEENIIMKADIGNYWKNVTKYKYKYLKWKVFLTLQFHEQKNVIKFLSNYITEIVIMSKYFPPQNM